MRNLSILVVIIFATVIGLTFLGLKTYSKKAQLLREQDENLLTQVNQQFTAYRNARSNTVLFACTQKFADYQKIKLSNNFYKQQKHYDSMVATAQQALYEVLRQAKNRFKGKEVRNEIDGFLKFDNEVNQVPITAHGLTRGYCREYQTGFTEKIIVNLAHYQIAPPTSNSTSVKTNAIYVNSHFQVINMTNNLGKRSLPTSLFLDSKSYPIQCHYQNVQDYDQAIATQKPVKDMAFKASDYFYQHYTPHINYILTCQTDSPLSIKQIMQWNDTYPWYQPIAAGSDNQTAAGDVFIYLNRNRFIIVLGHEPCACNRQSDQKCSELKAVTRGFKERAWKLFTALEENKPNHNAEAQAAMVAYLTWGKSEIKKDYCYLDRAGIINRFLSMTEQVKRVEPNGPLKPPIN